MRNLFTKREIDMMKCEAEEIYDEDRRGKPFDGEESQYVQPFFERKPFLSLLPDDDRIYDIAEDLLGPDFFLDGTEGRLRVGPTAWHGAVPRENAVPSVKINIYPTLLTKNNGCLRVIPGSHLVSSPDLYEPLRSPNYGSGFRPFGMLPTDIPCVPLEICSGDVVVFQESLLHSSFGGNPGRHQLAINFLANPINDEQVEEIINGYRTSKWSFRPSESYITSDRPRIRRMVNKLVELGFTPLKY